MNILSDTPNSTENQIYSEEEPDLKQGIKLPTSSREWEMVNDCYKFKFWNQPKGREYLDSTIKTMNDVINDYFLQNYGISSTKPNGKLIDNYKHKSIKE